MTELSEQLRRRLAKLQKSVPRPRADEDEEDEEDEDWAEFYDPEYPDWHWIIAIDACYVLSQERGGLSTGDL